MSKDRYERSHRRTDRHPDSVSMMSNADFDRVPSLSEAMGLESVTVEVIQGVEGACLSIRNRRVAGPKPWGGGNVVYSFTVDVDELRKALS